MDKLFDALRPAMYKYNDKISSLETEKITFGVMAQDIRRGIENSGYDPDNYSIVKMNDTGYYSVDYVQLIPILIKEIQILDKKVQELEKLHKKEEK
jgi:hypothetical protein